MKFLKKISDIMQKVMSMLLLTVAYIIGIGIVSVFGKIRNMTFLNRAHNVSTWITYKRPTGPHTMY